MKLDRTRSSGISALLLAALLWPALLPERAHSTIPWFADPALPGPIAWNGLPLPSSDELGRDYGWVTARETPPLDDPRFDYDVDHYGIVLDIDPDARTLRGSVAMTFRALTDLATVVLDMGPTLVADSVLVDESAVPFLRGEGQLSVTLPAPLETDEGETIVVR